VVVMPAFARPLGGNQGRDVGDLGNVGEDHRALASVVPSGARF